MDKVEKWVSFFQSLWWSSKLKLIRWLVWATSIHNVFLPCHRFKFWEVCEKLWWHCRSTLSASDSSPNLLQHIVTCSFSFIHSLYLYLSFILIQYLMIGIFEWKIPYFSGSESPPRLTQGVNQKHKCHIWDASYCPVFGFI